MDIVRRQPQQRKIAHPLPSRPTNTALSDTPKNFNQTADQNIRDTEMRAREALKKEYGIISQKPAPKNKKIVRKLSLLFFVLLLFFAIISAGFLVWKTYSTGKKISVSQHNGSFSENVRGTMSSLLGADDTKMTLRGYDEGRINILLLGAAGEKKPGKNLTDTVMIMSIDTQNKKVALLSLPRDLYVKLGHSQIHTKLNSVYQISLAEDKNADYAKQAVAEITGLEMHYYAVVDFDAFTQVIDKIGGIKVTVERDIYDTRYPGPNYSYETFKLDKGLQDLDGATALKYVRERHDDPQGDFGRAKRQQQVIQAVKNKIFSAQTLLNPLTINAILNSVGNNIKTDLSLEEMEQFLKLSRMVDMQNITNAVVDAWKPESLLKVSHVELGGVNAFILIPRVGNYSEIQELAQNIFNQDILKKRQENIANEDASLAIINRSGDHSLPQKINSLLEGRLNMKNVIIENEKTKAEQDDSFVQDNTSGQKLFTLDELTKKLPAKLSTDNPVEIKNNYDFIIVLGKDLADTYGYEENTIEEFNKAQDE